MIGAIIGAIGSVASAGLGTGMSINAARKQQRALKRKEKSLENWYNRRYNEDPTQRSEVQWAVTQMGNEIRKRNQAASGKQAVIGATEESTAATRESNNDYQSQAMGRIVSGQSARKDAVQDQYESAKEVIEDQKAGLYAQRSANTSAAAQGAISTAGQIASSIDADKSGVKAKAPAQTSATTDNGSDVAYSGPDFTPEPMKYAKRNPLESNPQTDPLKQGVWAKGALKYNTPEWLTRQLEERPWENIITPQFKTNNVS